MLVAELSRCAGRATMADSPMGDGPAHSAEAPWGPLRAASPSRGRAAGAGAFCEAAPRVALLESALARRT
eukprot:661766-Alexandrium_andersonii.AAC.1